MAITLQDAGGGYDPIAQFVGGELFPSFESSLFADGGEGGGYGGGGFQGAGYGAGGASVTVAQDISELFGSHWTAPEEERFEVDGDAMERRFRCTAAGWLIGCACLWLPRLLPGCLPGRAAGRPSRMLTAAAACGSRVAAAGRLALQGSPLYPHPLLLPAPAHSPCSTELERLRSQGVEAPRDRGDMFFGGGQDETFSPGAVLCRAAGQQSSSSHCIACGLGITHSRQHCIAWHQQPRKQLHATLRHG